MKSKENVLNKVVEFLLSIDSENFTEDSCEKVANYLRDKPIENLVEIMEHLTDSLEREIPERHNPDKVWIPVPYLVKKFKIHQRIILISIISHVSGEKCSSKNLAWQESYR